MALPRLTPDQRRLAEKHAHLPLKATRSFFRQKGIRTDIVGIEFDDVYGAANEAFCHIVRRWRPGRAGSEFEKYAMELLKWRITDFMRLEGPKMRTLTNTKGETVERWKPRMVPWTVTNEDGDDEYTIETVMRAEDRDPGFEGDTIGWSFVQHALTKLNERERSIIWMRYVEGLSLEQIGDVLGVTAGRISQLEGKALHKLRKDKDVLRTAAEILG